MHFRAIAAALLLLSVPTDIHAEELSLQCELYPELDPDPEKYYLTAIVDDLTAETLTGQIYERGNTHDFDDAAIDRLWLTIFFGDGNIFAVTRFTLDAMVNVGGAINPLPEDHIPNLHFGTCEIAERQF